MRKNILIVGLVLLVIGIALIGVSTFSLGHSSSATFSSSTVMIQGPNGDYHSQELNVTSGDVISVSTASKVYLIPASDLVVANQSNVNSFAISPLSSSSSAVTYNDLTGSYYVVVFSTSSPSVAYVVGNTGSLISAGIMIIIGGLLFFIGLIITIIGAVLKKKPLPGQVP